MKHTRTIAIIGFITLLSALGSGESYADEDIVHRFQAMCDAKTLVLSDGNSIGVTDLVTYTCNNSYASFGADFFNPPGSKKICLNFESYGMMTTTAIENLKEIKLYYLSKEAIYNKLKFSLSTDSISWEPLTGGAVAYEASGITATFPKGNYYIRMINDSGSKSVSILQIRYTVHNCNCFPYTAPK